ncbi:MAG: hypothetical protein AB1714_03290 [Acidobacteriota bacterium]
MAIDPTNPSTICAGTDGGGVFRSTDSDASWMAVNTGLKDLEMLALAIDPTKPATTYAGTHDRGVFKSTNGCASCLSPPGSGTVDVKVTSSVTSATVGTFTYLQGVQVQPSGLDIMAGR